MISFGIDIGGTFIKVLAINTKGEVLKSEKFKTPCQLSSHKFLQFLSETINNWKKELKTKLISSLWLTFLQILWLNSIKVNLSLWIVCKRFV